MVLGLFGMAIGALITWLVARYYYERASNELKAEAADLKKSTHMILRALENAGIASLNRDEQGNIIGLVLDIQPQSVLHLHGSTKAKLRKKET